MVTAYKTPGVYVEEISLFPPSVAQVETAVPAFIGYTATASSGGKSLGGEPTKIVSLAEYEELFGKSPPITVNRVELDVNNNVTSVQLEAGFLMYDAIRLFFANGGSKCYVVSIGNPFPATTAGAEAAHFLAGLKRIEKEDEPTILLFPDAVLLSDSKLYEVQQAALAQCAKLGDRVALLDLYPQSEEVSFQDTVDEFRDSIGISDLKYGAAYAPYLRTNLDKTITYRHLQGKLFRSGAPIELAGLASSAAQTDAIMTLTNAIEDVNAWLALLPSGASGVLSSLNAAETEFKAVVQSPAESIASKRTAYTALLQAVFATIREVVDAAAANADDDFTLHVPVPPAKKIRHLLDDVRESVLNGALFDAASRLNALVAHATRVGINNLSDTIDLGELVGPWGALAAGAPADVYPRPSGDAADETANMVAGSTRVTGIVKTLGAELSRLSGVAANYERTYEAALALVFPPFSIIVKRSRNAVTSVPPSPAIAGVYARVDADRGVHKAPANVSLSSVVGVTQTVSHEEQQDLNVDVVAGKSINVIRAFTGKGILVWGARTLDGNDNEWRYVPVRRFFNMVEESTKKATERFVFEPNDANTWSKVKAMIENFLILQWRGGALAGKTPEQAFFVKVGLGQTMTALDVLEGRMIVEIGMAVVRPAEFIILRFSHKMQES